MPVAELTVLTYNIYGGGQGDAAFEHRARLVTGAIAAVAPDVLCLQEVPSAEYLRTLMAMFVLRLRKPAHVATTLVDRADGTTSRIAVLHPGTSSAATWIRTPAGGRAGIAVTLRTQPLTVICTHFDSVDASSRAAQAEAVARHAGRATAGLVCGDLNARPGAPEILPLEAQLTRLAPAPEASHTFPTGLRPEHANRPRAVFDQILGRGVTVAGSGLVGLEPDETGLWPSDHAGVWAKVTIVP